MCVAALTFLWCSLRALLIVVVCVDGMTCACACMCVKVGSGLGYNSRWGERERENVGEGDGGWCRDVEVVCFI